MIVQKEWSKQGVLAKETTFWSNGKKNLVFDYAKRKKYTYNSSGSLIKTENL